MTNIEKLTKAIENRKPITFEYIKEGKTAGTRKGNPHALYIFEYKDPTKESKTKLDLVQTGGVSDSREEKPFPDFRQFFVTDLSNIEILENESVFEPLYEKLNEETGEMEKRYNPESDYYKNPLAKV